MYKVDGSTSKPLYLQIKVYLLQQIANGTFKVGQQVPSEAKLMDQFGVSRVTVRAAISELVEEGALIKRQGKGTFVNQNKMTEPLRGGAGFYESCYINHLSPSSKTVHAEIEEMPGNIKEALGITGESMGLHCRFIRFVDKRPIMLDEVWYVPRFFYLLDGDINGALYPLIRERENCSLSIAGGYVETCRATQSEAEMLKIKKDDTLLLVVTVVKDDQFRPVHWGKKLILGERFRLFI
ncbi:MAG: GntR family transcriptional regulator [Clostridiales bacterium]|uniref:GntR family transcriptional regulator n=1 Tax=Oscillospiraceae TaxID=216572 RepID=UPI0009A776E6|nr:MULTISPECIES: GntR family transcriptional regulator [Oscillospiraceae]PWM41144.1 MAG: GntR family transcriptional regulator [Clostridiales bacterium]RGB67912.1 GntR family transcriptional regulator [Harryflintia acetispora]